jgi:hypothetical protein
MNAREVVSHEMQRNHMNMVFDLLAKRVRQPREAAHVHPHREVLPLNVAGADMVGIRRARDGFLLRADANAGAVTAGRFSRLALGLHQHGVIDVTTESFLPGPQVGTMTVRNELHPGHDPLGQIVDEPPRRVASPVAHQP